MAYSRGATVYKALYIKPPVKKTIKKKKKPNKTKKKPIKTEQNKKETIKKKKIDKNGGRDSK